MSSDIRRQAHALRPSVVIGKEGLTDRAIGHLKKILKEKRLVKVKMRKSAFESLKKEELIAKILDETNSRKIHQVGDTIVLHK